MTGSLPSRPLAVVTGASSGIGLELALQFARNGFDLLINSGTDAIGVAAEGLSGHGVAVQSVVADLSTFDGVEQLYAAIRTTGRPVDAIAINAGFGLGGAFAETDLTRELQMIDLNVKSTVHLAKRVLADMVLLDEGRILFTSSIASTMPGTFQAVYNATKSFVQSFSEALRNELKDTGITVTALMPGATDTQFFDTAEMTDTKVGQSKKDDPADVAKQGYEALMAGKQKVVAASVKTKLAAAANTVLPDSVKAEAHRTVAEPGSGSG